MPALPRHARYLHHKNECFDWGTIGWVFTEGHANPEDYEYFIFMNSSVRGPFLPPYMSVGAAGAAAEWMGGGPGGIRPLFDASGCWQVQGCQMLHVSDLSMGAGRCS
jgi:hypothetical protein